MLLNSDKSEEYSTAAGGPYSSSPRNLRLTQRCDTVHVYKSSFAFLCIFHFHARNTGFRMTYVCNQIYHPSSPSYVQAFLYLKQIYGNVYNTSLYLTIYDFYSSFCPIEKKYIFLGVRFGTDVGVKLHIRIRIRQKGPDPTRSGFLAVVML
jgi:hypothetical protein